MYFIASDLAISSLVKRNSAAIKTEIFFIELLRIKRYDSFSEFIYWTDEYKMILSFHVFQQRTQMSIAVSVVGDFYLSTPEASQCLPVRARPDLSWHLETIGRTDRLGGIIEYKQWAAIKETVTLGSFDKKHCKGVTFKSWAHEIDFRTNKRQITSIVNIAKIDSWCETRTWWWTPWRNLW